MWTFVIFFDNLRKKIVTFRKILKMYIFSRMLKKNVKHFFFTLPSTCNASSLAIGQALKMNKKRNYISLKNNIDSEAIFL